MNACGSPDSSELKKATVASGDLRLGAAGAASAHVNAYGRMTLNIDVDNDDADTKYFSFGKNSASGEGAELARLTEAGDLGVGTARHSA